VAWENSFFESADGFERHGIGTALVKGMAAAEPAKTQPDAARRPVDLNGFAHVIRAGRIEAAGGRQKGRNQAFVPDEESGKDFGESSSEACVSEARCESRLHLMKRRRTSA